MENITLDDETGENRYMKSCAKRSLIGAFVAIILSACSNQNSEIPVSTKPLKTQKICGTQICEDMVEPVFYRRALYACGFELDYSEPLPTISPLLIRENVNRGALVHGRMEVFQTTEDLFPGYAPKLDCNEFTLDELSLVEIFEAGPDGEVSNIFPDQKLESLKKIGSEQPSSSCKIDVYEKPFSNDLNAQVFVVARHIKFDKADGIKCSAAAHLILAGLNISNGVDDYIELSGPLKNRLRFDIDNDAREND